jgi:NADH-quinone oxidoreductase subunit J
MGEVITFYALATLICILSLAVISAQKPITAVVCLVFDLFFVAGLYAMQGADFAAAIQVIIYTGAILVLFLFVIMFLHTHHEYKSNIFTTKTLILSSIIVTGLTALTFRLLSNTSKTSTDLATNFDNTYEIAKNLFVFYLWPFEIASLLILLAIVACVVITKSFSTKE